MFLRLLLISIVSGLVSSGLLMAFSMPFWIIALGYVGVGVAVLVISALTIAFITPGPMATRHLSKLSSSQRPVALSTTPAVATSTFKSVVSERRRS